MSTLDFKLRLPVGKIHNLVICAAGSPWHRLLGKVKVSIQTSYSLYCNGFIWFHHDASYSLDGNEFVTVVRLSGERSYIW